MKEVLQMLFFDYSKETKGSKTKIKLILKNISVKDPFRALGTRLYKLIMFILKLIKLFYKI